MSPVLNQNTLKYVNFLKTLLDNLQEIQLSYTYIYYRME